MEDVYPGKHGFANLASALELESHGRSWLHVSVGDFFFSSIRPNLVQFSTMGRNSSLKKKKFNFRSKHTVFVDRL